jgi:hypothetical protein
MQFAHYRRRRDLINEAHIPSFKIAEHTTHFCGALFTRSAGGSVMQAIEIQEHARKLKDAHGDKAILEAAQKARELDETGDREQAETWRRIEAALMQMQGPHLS